MAKRFTDTEKFNDVWYRRLPLLQKVIWEYLLSECNHAGIFENFDYDMMSFKIGAEISETDMKCFEGRIVFLNETTLFIPKFIKFQYGELNAQNKAHASVLRELEKWGIQAPSKPLTSPLQAPNYPLPSPFVGAKDKDKDKEKDKEEEKEKGKEKKKKTDIFCNPDFEKCYEIYRENCENLIPLSRERHNRAILEELRGFLDETDYDFGYFLNLCKRANLLKKIVNTRIDFRSMVRNHIGIMNGKYDNKASPRGVSQDFIDSYFDEKRKEETQSG